MCEQVFIQFIDAISALHDEVEKCRVLAVHPCLSHASQLHLLEEWALFSTDKFQYKLCINADIFAELMNLIQGHPIFHNNSNNPQLPIAGQLAVFLNSIGHYGNATTTEDISDWARVPVGPSITATSIASKSLCRKKTCHEWHGGFLCVDGTLSPLHKKPGWHGDGFFDKNLDYSLTAQVIIFPHNLCINPKSFFGVGEWLWADSAYTA
ncbi:hypothetical protein BDR04DRAFT_1128369 [Suillus decipiens]|nr:hypothetical protein BDR04DRAFT_1128369 [Suillus decipiens]